MKENIPPLNFWVWLIVLSIVLGEPYSMTSQGAIINLMKFLFYLSEFHNHWQIHFLKKHSYKNNSKWGKWVYYMVDIVYENIHSCIIVFMWYFYYKLSVNGEGIVLLIISWELCTISLIMSHRRKERITSSFITKDCEGWRW